jgi:hypothetical protein
MYRNQKTIVFIPIADNRQFLRRYPEFVPELTRGIDH